MDRDGGRSTGVFLAASEEQPHSNEKNKSSLQNPLRKVCGRCARGLQKLPSPPTVSSGCASTTYGIAEHIFVN
jgi:hypothetical protein